MAPSDRHIRQQILKSWEAETIGDWIELVIDVTSPNQEALPQGK